MLKLFVSIKKKKKTYLFEILFNKNNLCNYNTLVCTENSQK